MLNKIRIFIGETLFKMATMLYPNAYFEAFDTPSVGVVLRLNTGTDMRTAYTFVDDEKGTGDEKAIKAATKFLGFNPMDALQYAKPGDKELTLQADKDNIGYVNGKPHGKYENGKYTKIDTGDDSGLD